MLSVTPKASATNFDFIIFACGTGGGGYASDLTSFFIAESSKPRNFMSMDAGTSLDCIKAAAVNHQLDKILDETPYGTQKANANHLDKIGYFRKEQLNAFLATHVHSDHLAGLVISSAEDKLLFGPGKMGPVPYKPVIGRNSIMEGVEAQLLPPYWPANVWYYFHKIEPKTPPVPLSQISAEKQRKMVETVPTFPDLWKTSQFTIKTYPLVHALNPITKAPVESTAFRICNDASCVLFAGDTGPDHPVGDTANPGPPEQDAAKGPLHKLWDGVYRNIDDGIIHTIFLECSYSDPRKSFELFGHLTPYYIIKEMEYLATKLRRTPKISLVIMHIKPVFNVEGGGDEIAYDVRDRIRTQLAPLRDIHGIEINVIIPKSTDILYVKKGSHAAVDAAATVSDKPVVHIHPKHYDKHRVHDHHNMFWLDVDKKSPWIPNDYTPHIHDHDFWIFGEAAVLMCVVGLSFLIICFVVGMCVGHRIPSWRRKKGENDRKRRI